MVIPFPTQTQSAVIVELERALQAARSGQLVGIALSYISDGVMSDCVEASDYHTALMLMGQSNMVRIDLIDLTRKLREGNQCAALPQLL